MQVIALQLITKGQVRLLRRFLNKVDTRRQKSANAFNHVFVMFGFFGYLFVCLSLCVCVLVVSLFRVQMSISKKSQCALLCQPCIIEYVNEIHIFSTQRISLSIHLTKVFRCCRCFYFQLFQNYSKQQNCRHQHNKLMY